MDKLVFKLMKDSFVESTIDMPDSVGISVALWRMKALMLGYQWALDHGMVIDNGETKQ